MNLPSSKNEIKDFTHLKWMVNPKYCEDGMITVEEIHYQDENKIWRYLGCLFSFRSDLNFNNCFLESDHLSLIIINQITDFIDRCFYIFDNEKRVIERGSDE